MMPSVFSVEAALATVRFQAASSLETIRLGKSVSPNRNAKAAIVQEEETKAYSGRPW
jgi:hypothetical protein